jgi:ABC-type dipeptide/oligopeptide/nickel transport system permease subunit
VRPRRFFDHRLAAPALTLVALFAALATLAPLLTAYAPSQQLDIVALQNQPPSWRHPFGTDLLSRDVWSRVVYGTRVSLGIGVLAAVIAAGVGTAIGVAAGLAGRLVDGLLMRLVDVGLAVPRFFVVLAALAVGWRVGPVALALLIGLTGWFATSRLVRAEVLGLAVRPFTESARALGATPLRVALRHVLPNTLPLVLVSTALGIAHAMLLEAGLSFLGAGVRPPAASWGNMIAEARDQLTVAPWSSLAPGVALTLAVVAFHGLADALRHAVDPRDSEGKPDVPSALAAATPLRARDISPIP